MEHQNKSGASKRGFAAMGKEQQRKIASMGGKASHGGRGSNSDSSSSKRDSGK